MYRVMFKKVLVALTKLEHGDPPMGVAHGIADLQFPSAGCTGELESLGATNENDVISLRGEDLFVTDSDGVRIPGEFCYLCYVPEVDEATIEVCAIPSQEYEKLFPEHCAKYK